jgi:diguanylate cyclase (GGDEF)-like protein/PAS domain S-box-containing protein
METHNTNDQARFRLISDTVDEAISVCNPDGCRVYNNRAYQVLFGCDEPRPSQDPFDHVSLDDRDRIRTFFYEVVQDRNPGQIIYKAVLPDGKMPLLESRVAPLLNDIGEVIEVLFITRDLTKQQKIDGAQLRHNRELELRISEMSLLNAMATQIYRCNSVNELRKVLKNDAWKLFSSCSGAMYIFNTDLNQFGEFLEWGDASSREKYFSNDQCWSIRNDNGVHVVENPDPDIALLCSHVSETKHPYICIHMRGKGDINLLLHLELSSSLEELPSDEEMRRSMRALQEVATAVARHSALAIENLSQKDDLRKAAELDELTGLFNRHYLASTLKREVLRAARSKTIIGVIMVDVDNFKKINDSYTHSGGDYVLREVGHFLRKNVRETDIPCRYGGEEFMLIMPDATYGGLKDRAEAIREGVKELSLEFYGRPVKLTLSLGVAMMAGQDAIAPDHVIRLAESAQFVAEEKAEEITQAADTALYNAKRNGRDRVEFWQGQSSAEISA